VSSIHYVQQQPRNGDRPRFAGARATVAGVGVKPLYHLICIAVPRREGDAQRTPNRASIRSLTPLSTATLRHDHWSRPSREIRRCAWVGRLEFARCPASTAEELDERLEAALTARTYGELAALTTDLPAIPDSGPGRPVPEPKDLARIDCRGSSVTRDGRWPVPQRMEVRVTGGSVTLDFTEAVISRPSLLIDADVRASRLTLGADRGHRLPAGPRGRHCATRRPGAGDQAGSAAASGAALSMPWA
jgi:hypothetical protein